MGSNVDAVSTAVPLQSIVRALGWSSLSVCAFRPPRFDVRQALGSPGHRVHDLLGRRGTAQRRQRNDWCCQEPAPLGGQSRHSRRRANALRAVAHRVASAGNRKKAQSVSSWRALCCKVCVRVGVLLTFSMCRIACRAEARVKRATQAHTGGRNRPPDAAVAVQLWRIAQGLPSCTCKGLAWTIVCQPNRSRRARRSVAQRC